MEALKRMHGNYIIRQLHMYNLWWLCTRRRTRYSKAAVDCRDSQEIVESNKAITAHMRNGRCDCALRVFNHMPHQSLASYNAMISGYMRMGKLEDANKLFDKMPERNLRSWNAMLSGYVRNNMIEDAQKFFDLIPEKDVFTWNTMLKGYAQNRDVDEAKKFFDRMHAKDDFSWKEMLSAYVKNGRIKEAFQFFESRSDWDEVALNTMISCHVRLRNMSEATKLFVKPGKRNVIACTTMMFGFLGDGMIEEAKKYFDMMSEKNEIAYSAMINGFARYGCYGDALDTILEKYKIKDGKSLNGAACNSVLRMCAKISALDLGKQVHGQAVKTGFETGCFVGNALLAMYSECGSIVEANIVFEALEEKDIVSWNTMIGGYGRHGFGERALKLLESMKTAGVKPDDITMVKVLFTCSHTGLTDMGIKYFYSMEKDYGVTPTLHHYNCIIDLLGRAGHLEQAWKLQENMPFKPNAITWGTIAGASRIHSNFEVAEMATAKLLELDPHNPGVYLLSNLYAAGDRWDDVGKTRSMIRNIGIKKKVPGYSQITVQDKFHTFMVNDRFHPERDRIYAVLEGLYLHVSEGLHLHGVE